MPMAVIASAASWTLDEQNDHDGVVHDDYHSSMIRDVLSHVIVHTTCWWPSRMLSMEACDMTTVGLSL